MLPMSLREVILLRNGLTGDSTVPVKHWLGDLEIISVVELRLCSITL